MEPIMIIKRTPYHFSDVEWDFNLLQTRPCDGHKACKKIRTKSAKKNIRQRKKMSRKKNR